MTTSTYIFHRGSLRLEPGFTANQLEFAPQRRCHPATKKDRSLSELCMGLTGLGQVA